MRPAMAESGSPGVLLGQRIEDRVERRQPGSGSPVRTAWTTSRMASRTSSGCSSWILWPLWVAITSLPPGTQLGQLALELAPHSEPYRLGHGQNSLPSRSSDQGSNSSANQPEKAEQEALALARTAVCRAVGEVRHVGVLLPG
jgi:hypothetical protein